MHGLIEIVPADTPRFNLNPGTLASKGLLLEEARTNMILAPKASWRHVAWQIFFFDDHIQRRRVSIWIYNFVLNRSEHYQHISHRSPTHNFARHNDKHFVKFRKSGGSFFLQTLLFYRRDI